MTGATVSVIIVSRGRPDALMRCLKAVEQLYFGTFEVIVVADPAGLKAVGAGGLSPLLKTVEFGEANISAARNHGLAVARGDIVVFIDDDSVPEPTWLSYLIAAFANADVVAAGGYVLGRNGISLQNKARSVDRCGRHSALDMPGNSTRVFDATPDRAIKTEGTNCAFRREILLKMGGFDPAFHFFMDETDLNLRFAAAGLKTAIVPLARVHHGFAASDQRRQSRMPKTLFDIGASQMVLLRKHAAPDQVGAVLDEVRAEQRARLLRHMVAGNCEPRDIGRLLDTLQAGFDEGQGRPVDPLGPISPATDEFRTFKPRTAHTGMGVLAGRNWSARTLRRAASARVANGERISLFLFSPTTFYHRVRFDRAGYWEQRGGLFGKAERTDPLFRMTKFRKRLKSEVGRVGLLRKFEG